MGKYREPELVLTDDEVAQWTTRFSPHLVKSAYFTEALRRALISINGTHPKNTEHHAEAVVGQTLLNMNDYQ